MELRDVSRVGYGAMQLEKLAGAGGAAERQRALAVLRSALELGVNHIDTAGFYGDQTVNELIREALWPYPQGLVIVSKIGAAHVAGKRPPLVPAQLPAELRAAVEADLHALGVERIDVVNLRRLDAAPGIVATGDQLVPLDDQLAELIKLREEGKLGAIGLSGVSAQQLEQALPAGIACVQNLYSLVDRSAETLLELCCENQVAWVPFFPLGGAFPGRPKVVEQPAVIDAAAALGATPAQVGLAWLLAHAPNILLIPGTARLQHLAENMAAGTLELSPETLASLDALEPVAPAPSSPSR